ncbi:hypothetical protein OAV94_01995 [Candidatus Pelagibacter sp.]|nr:hypothetical protein [Candidatus Pelagibacter sp.]
MKFFFMGLEFSLKKKSKRNLLTQKDIDNYNDKVIKYLKRLNIDEINKRLEDVTFTVDHGIKKLKQILLHNGIVIIPDYIPQGEMNKISQELNIIKKKVSSFISSNQSFKNEDNVLFQKGDFKIKGYDAQANFHKASVNIRQGQDLGMIDIFNIDKWYSSIGNTIKPYLNNKMIIELINKEESYLKPKNLNLYINNGVTKTRGFHVDSYSRQIKSFVYLEDCLSLECGPYTYVKKSHTTSSLKKINNQISSILPNKTETPIVLLKNIVPVLAKKGSLIISTQEGSHRGFPQSPGYQRTVAVMNYYKT